MHCLTPSAAVVALIRKNNGKIELLLQKRQNTGFADGMWDLSCSGHVEAGESISSAAVRESREELSVEIKEEDLRFFALIHKNDAPSNVTYYNVYFSTDKFSGEPKIMESGKCSEIQWVALDNLPDGLLEDRKVALKSLLCDAKYYAYGWE